MVRVGAVVGGVAARGGAAGASATAVEGRIAMATPVDGACYLADELHQYDDENYEYAGPLHNVVEGHLAALNFFLVDDKN